MPAPLVSLSLKVKLPYMLETETTLRTLENVPIDQLLLVWALFQALLELRFQCKTSASFYLIGSKQLTFNLASAARGERGVSSGPSFSVFWVSSGLLSSPGITDLTK